MTLKNSAVNLIKRFASSPDCMVSVDFVVSQGPMLILSGWAASKSSSFLVDNLSASRNGNVLELSSFPFSRPDVVKHHNLSQNDYCIGFLIVIDNFSQSVDSLVLKYGNSTFPLSKQRYRQATNLAEILSNVPDKRDEATSFVESYGLKLNKRSASNLVIRHSDKDVEKIKGILQGVDIAKVDALETLHSEALPEIHRIWKAKQSKNNNRELKGFGDEIDEPKVSVVIPLYGRYDFMQHQLANFAADPFMSAVEVIYVLDDPGLQREVLITAHGLFKTFRYPFKLVLSERNRGFAGANNLGVEFATSENLLLLNSDILPEKNGWLEDYLEQFVSIEDVGIMGATLTYEDKTVQHAGMEFREDSHYPGIWMNHHPFKGVPVDLVPLDDVFQTPITTGACMLMTTKLYRDLEGFDPMYVLGDFEDSDLCLKVIDKGFKIYVSGKIKLYHLERLSQDLVDSGDWKFKLTLANGAYQANKWRNLIQELSA